MSITGDVFTKEKAGLVMVKELQLVVDIVKVLESDKQLPVKVELKATETVKSAFA